MSKLHNITSAGRVPRMYLKFPSPTYYHIYTHLGDEVDWLTNDEKKHFVELLRRLSKVFAVEILTYSVLSNHYHILLRALGYDSLDEVEAWKRALQLYKPWRVHMRSGKYWRERLTDISFFLKELNQRFSRWLNLKRRRKGGLWRDRFSSVVIEENSLLPVMLYVDLNPWKAGEDKENLFVGYMDKGDWLKGIEGLGLTGQEYKTLIENIIKERTEWKNIYEGKGIVFGEANFVEEVIGRLPWRRRKRRVGEKFIVA